MEFVGGGWAMNDEASVHYTAIIDNVGSGTTYLKSIFGEGSRITFYILFPLTHKE